MYICMYINKHQTFGTTPKSSIRTNVLKRQVAYASINKYAPTLPMRRYDVTRLKFSIIGLRSNCAHLLTFVHAICTYVPMYVCI